jgi:hypothetical protein
MTELSVGQKLWFVPFSAPVFGDCKWVTIETIGPKRVIVDFGPQFDPAEMATSGKAPLEGDPRYRSPGFVYLSRDSHDKEMEFRLLKWKVIALLQDRTLSFEQMSAIEKILEVKNKNVD